MYKKIILFLLIGTSTFFSVTMFQMNILWNLFERNNELKTVAYIIASSLILQSLISLLSGIFIDKYSQKNLLKLSLIGFMLVAIICYITSSTLIIVLAYLLFIVLNVLFQKTFIVIVTHQLSTNEYIKYDAISGILNQFIVIFCNLISGVLISYISQEINYMIIIFGFLATFIFIFNMKDTNDKQEIIKTNTKITFEFISNNLIKDKKVLVFIVILFLLNLDYGYIPNVLPYYMVSISKNVTPVFLSFLKSAVNVGEIVGGFIIIYASKKVSKLTKIGLLGSGVSFVILPVFSSYSLGLFLVLLLYGLFDTLTQPLFSYFISNIENSIKGRMIGMIDCIVYISAPVGILIGNYLSKFGIAPVSIFISLVFFISFFIFNNSVYYNNIELKEVD